MLHTARDLPARRPAPAIGASPRPRLRIADAGSSVPEPLLPRVARGDRAAMAETIERYGGLVWSIARTLGMLDADAEDAVQDVYLAVWDCADRYDARLGAESTFVGIIARRRIIDWGRRRGRRARLDDRAGRQRLERSARAGTEDASADVSDEIRRIESAIETLPDAQRDVLRLALHGELTHEQIARSTELPLGTVKTHIRRGLHRVRGLLSRGSDDGHHGRNA